MNFFDAQERARRATRWLVVGYLLATILIVSGVTLVVAFALAGFGTTTAGVPDVWGAHGGLLLATAAGATLFIAGASLYKTAALSSGGSKVASAAGGTLVAADTTDPDRRRLRNIVEEIAIASGVPVPDIFILEAESGINAFAAGYAPGDAAIAVTRGALELLERDELQGVIAHEFSHILNGDMRLNIRLMGILFGIMVLGLIGRVILRGGYHGSLVSARRDRNAAAVLLIGAGLAILGAIGVLFARLIKASVSRQREVLADASAVQFTRQTQGIAGALKKIGGYEKRSYLEATDPEEISHMLFGSGAKLSSLFATHPPLLDRIRALDPSFQPADYPRVQAGRRAEPVREDAPPGMTALHDTEIAASAASIIESVGNPANRHIAFAGMLRQSIPLDLYDAAHSPDLAYLLTVALILDTDTDLRQRQFSLLDERLGAARRRVVEQLAASVSAAGPRYRLPLLEVAFPALKKRPRQALEFLLDLARRLIELDRSINLYEYCFYRILSANLDQATDPHRTPTRRAAEKLLRLAQVNLLGLVAHHGHPGDANAREQAFSAGIGVLGRWADGYDRTPQLDVSVALLDQSLDALRSLELAARRRLIEAVTVTATHDGRLRIAEAELVRVVCASLDCPLPPILESTLPVE